jgi:hypothetical protein
MCDVSAFRGGRSAAEEVVSTSSSALWCCCVGVWGGIQGPYRIMDVKIAFFSDHDRARRQKSVPPSLDPKMENGVEADRINNHSDTK